MKRFVSFFLLFMSTMALGAGPQPCYFSGQYFKCFPPSGYASVDGTVSLPAVSFVADPDSGLYRIGANDLGVAVNGALSLEVTTTGIKAGTFTPTDTTKGLLGTTTNDAAAAGYVGELKSLTTSRASPVTLTTSGSGVYDVVGPLSITAGDWDIWYVAAEGTGASTAQTALDIGISQTSATMPGIANAAGGAATLRYRTTIVPPVNIDMSWGTLGPIQVSLSGSQNYYAVYTATFTGTAPNGYGTLYARRRR